MQSIFRQIEKDYKKFKTKEIVIFLGIGIGSTIIFSQFSDEFKALKKWIHKKTGKETFFDAFIGWFGL